jgi:hypothetical protein
MNSTKANTLRRARTLALLTTVAFSALAQTTHQIDVNRGTVVYAAGNDLTVKMEDGMVRHFVVPADYKLSVDGKQVSVQDLTPGTKLTQTITTTTQDQLVSDVRTVDLKVLEVKAPYLTIATGDKIKHLRVPEGTRFTVNGKEMMLADLKADMRIKGTVVTTVPTTTVSQGRKVTGTVRTPNVVGVLLIEQTPDTAK